MAFAAGVFTKLYSWVTEQASSPIEISKLDAQESDFATGLSSCLLRDGTGLPTAAIPFNGQKITGLGNAAADADALNRITADGRYGGVVQIAVKSADETVNNSATLQDDDHLTMTAAAGVYMVDMLLVGTSTNNTPGIKVQLTYAGTFTASPKSNCALLLGSGLAANVSEFTTSSGLSTPRSLNWLLGADGNQLHINGILTLTVGGILKLQWAQSTAHASNTVVSAGSYLKLTKIA